jgi:hypothetical protein
MPLQFQVVKPLVIPGDAYNADDVAVIVVTGGRYGGQWALNAIATHGSKKGCPIGEIETERDERPSMALDTALVWVNDACAKARVKLVTWQNKNDQYGPDEAQFFASAIFVIDRR